MSRSRSKQAQEQLEAYVARARHWLADGGRRNSAFERVARQHAERMGLKESEIDALLDSEEPVAEPDQPSEKSSEDDKDQESQE